MTFVALNSTAIGIERLRAVRHSALDAEWSELKNPIQHRRLAMPFKSLHLTVVVVGLTLQPRQLPSQVPIQLDEARDSSSRAYVSALKAALLNSPSFRVVLDGGQTRRLWVNVLTGGMVTCGDVQARGVSIVVKATPERASDAPNMVVTSVYQVGREEAAARRQLANLHEAAVKLGLPDQSR